MRKITIYCDVCGKQITDIVYRVFFGGQEVDKVEDDPCFEQIEHEKDFCADCIGSVAKLIDTFAQPALDETEEPKPVEETPKKQKTEKADKDKRKKVDAAKVWALYDANWGPSSIAAEMGCSTQTIRNILGRERPDMEVGNA